MRANAVDLLPSAVRDRVLRVRKLSYSARTALGLVLIGAIAAAGAETARMEATERLELAQLAAGRTLAADEARGVLERRIDEESAALAQRHSERERVPLATLLAAAIAPLPEGAFLSRVRCVERAGWMQAEVSVTGADAVLLADALRSLAPMFQITEVTQSIVRFDVPRDQAFELTLVPTEDTDAR
ncbi:MAG: hypothetical protein SGJ09_07695 [Phycisphaerae bacterium]|nr:hypothetical protein [Phycisphaerae bacterium]